MAFASPTRARARVTTRSSGIGTPVSRQWCGGASTTRARAELESLLGAHRDDGFIGHTIFWDTPLNRRQRLTYNVLAHDAPMTASIQPPALAWAWRIAVGDPGAVPGNPLASSTGWPSIATWTVTG